MNDNTLAEPFNKASWHFPVKELRLQRAVVCLNRDAKGRTYCSGARLECEPLFLPDIDHAWKKKCKVTPHIMLKFTGNFPSLDSLAGQTLDLGQPVETCSDDLGSVYLFGAHNPVGWQRITFGPLKGKTIMATFDLLFDFDFEDNIGGRFRHTLQGPVVIERRWLLK